MNQQPQLEPEDDDVTVIAVYSPPESPLQPTSSVASTASLEQKVVTVDDAIPDADPMDHMNPVTAKTFRINAKRFFLTYPKCTLSKESILKWLNTKGRLIAYVIAIENHKDGTPHVHACVHYGNKLNIKSPDFFDVNGFHPNFGSVRNWPNATAYCKKDGNFIESASFDDYEPDKFRARKLDYKAWQIHNFKKQLRDPAELFPLVIKYELKGEVLEYLWQPSVMGKQRHLWICTAPNGNKTRWLNEVFDGYKIYLRQDTNYPYEAIEDEKLVVFDDVQPKFTELVSVSNQHKVLQHVWGNSRYTQTYWAVGVDLTMVVLSNFPPDVCYDHQLVPAVLARFVVLDVERLV